MSEFKKNTATELTFCLVNASDGSAVTTGTTTCYYTLDGGTQATGNTATHEGNGQWSVAIDAAHINGDTAGFLMINSSAVPVNIHVNTTTKLVSELNDIAATAIVSSGAITTSGGAVSTVTSVTNGVTVTTNNDKTGYSLTQTFPTNFEDMAITDTTGLVSVGTNNDKTGYSISGTITTLDGLNDFDPATDTVANVTTTANLTTNNDKTGYSISGTLTTLDALENVSAAEVNAEVVDCLNTDTYAEPGQGAPGATISLAQKIGYIYKSLRNRKTATSSTISIYNDDATTVDHKRTISDGGSPETYNEGELESGP